MRKVLQVRKLGEIFLFVLGIIFAVFFFRAGQYWLSLFALLLPVLALRINDLQTLIVSPKEGITLKLSKANETISEIINSPKPSKEKIEESQKVIDEVFKLGYVAGGGKGFKNISNVKIMRNEDGQVIRYQYDES